MGIWTAWVCKLQLMRRKRPTAFLADRPGEVQQRIDKPAATLQTLADRELSFTENAVRRLGRITVGGSITDYAIPEAAAAPAPPTAGLPLEAISGGPDGGLWVVTEGQPDVSAAGRITTDGRITEFAALDGALAVILNPGGWFFVAAVASPLLALATLRGGVSGALLVAAAMIAGSMFSDVLVVMIGGVGVRR